MVGGRGGPCVHRNRCLRAKAACRIRLQGQRLRRWRRRRVVLLPGKIRARLRPRCRSGRRGPGGWIFRLELISQARGDGGGGGSGGSGGMGGSGGGRSWSLASSVCVVMGAIGKVFPTKKPFTGASFSNRCHHTTLHGSSVLPTLT